MTGYKDIANFEKYYGIKHGEPVSLRRVGATSISQNPDFTVQDQTPNEVGKFKFYVEASTARWSMANNSDVEWYAIKGKRSILKPGDLIVPLHTMSYPSTSPSITYFNQFPTGSVWGFKSTRLGAIYNGTTLVYDNIYFDYLPRSSFPGAPLDREMESSLGVPSVQAVMFERVLTTNLRDEEGLYLYQKDTNPQVIWVITNVTPSQAGSSAGLMVLDLKESVVR